MICGSRFLLIFRLIKQHISEYHYFVGLPGYFFADNIFRYFILDGFDFLDTCNISFTPQYGRVYESVWGICLSLNVPRVCFDCHYNRLVFLQRLLGSYLKAWDTWLENLLISKVEGRLWRELVITLMGLSLILSRADLFVRLKNRLGSHTLPSDNKLKSQVCWTPIVVRYWVFQ